MAANESYILFYGGPDGGWVGRFTEAANKVAQHRYLQQRPLNITLNVLQVRPDNGTEVRQYLPNKSGDGTPVYVGDLFGRFRNNLGGWAVLSQGNVGILLSDDGERMLQVLANFNGWARNIEAEQGGFGAAFMKFHQGLP